MKSARVSLPDALPEEPVNAVTGGLDWARDDHAVSIVDARGREIARCTVEHSAAGLRDLLAVLGRHGVFEVAIERPDGPVVDTDRARLRPLVPDDPTTVALRRACRARKDLVAHRVAVANQLRAHLRNVFPGAVGLFADIDSPISLAFLTRFTTQDRADWLSPKRLATWLAAVGYSGRKDPAVLHTHLTAAPRGITGPDAEAQAHITRALAAVLTAVLTTLVEQIKTLKTQISDQLTTHADQHIFTSLPRAGRVRAARLLAEIGDCRARFPTPEALACLAGMAPSTRQSGKLRTVGFRWACHKQLRDAVTDFANDTRHTNPWATDLYQRARDRGHDHAHAVRILGRARLFVIWHCWQHGIAYDPARHNALQRTLHRQREQAA